MRRGPFQTRFYFSKRKRRRLDADANEKEIMQVVNFLHCFFMGHKSRRGYLGATERGSSTNYNREKQTEHTAPSLTLVSHCPYTYIRVDVTHTSVAKVCKRAAQVFNIECIFGSPPM